MSKNFLYNKAWYEKSKKLGKDRIFSKYKYVRKFDSNSNQYKVVATNVIEKNEREINGESFIRNLYEFKSKNIKNDKLKASNCLFKLKCNKGFNTGLKNTDEVILKIEVKKQSDKLASLSKERKNNISRAIIEQELSKKPSIKDKEKVNVKGINITCYKSYDEYNESSDTNKILYATEDAETLKDKRDIYEIYKKINIKIYDVIDKVVKNNELFENRNYKDGLGNFISININDGIIEDFKCLNEKTNGNEDYINFTKFYLGINGTSDKKTSTAKEIFADKVIRFLDNKYNLSKEDIATFISEELIEYNVAKRVEKRVNFNVVSEKERKINTYIKRDRHQRYKNEQADNSALVNKDERVKALVDEIVSDTTIGDTLENQFNDIFEKFEVQKLANRAKTVIEEKQKSNSEVAVDTFLFGELKEHYKEITKGIDFEQLSDVQKEIYKIIYKFLRGRIDKCIEKGEFIDFGTTENRVETSRQKALQRMKQYILEHIIYVGKLQRMEFENLINSSNDDISKAFQLNHAEEELNIELLVLFSSVNMILNEIFRSSDSETSDEYIDFFGDGKYNKVIIKNLSNYETVLDKLGFIDENKDIDENFKSFIKYAYKLRSALIHSNFKKVKNFKDETEIKAVKNPSNIKDVLIALKPTDEQISKNLNLQVIYNTEEKQATINYINNLQYKNQENEKYLPSFSKLVPFIKKRLKEDTEFASCDEQAKSIIENAVIYVNEILYKKKMSDDEFLNKIKNNDNFDIATLYKNAQSKASKGDRKAIKKYQDKIINSYFDSILAESNLQHLFNVSDIPKSQDEILNNIANTNIDEKFIIKSIEKDIEIKTDFEYIISVMCLLANNKYSSAIRNRVFATKAWLSNFEQNTELYDRLTTTLDEIIKVKKLYTKNQLDIVNYDIYHLLFEKIKSDDNNKMKQEEYDLLKQCYQGDDIVSKAAKDIYEIFIDKEISKNTKLNKDDFMQFILMYSKFDNSPENNKVKVDGDGQKYGKYVTGTTTVINGFNEYINNYIAIYNDQKIKTYKDTLDEIIDFNPKFDFESVYTQGKNDNITHIYKQNIFNNTSKNTFNNIWHVYKGDFKELESLNLDDELKSTVETVDKTLSKLVKQTQGKAGKYKKYYAEEVINKDNEKFQSLFGLSRLEFDDKYKKICKYRCQNDKLEFNNISKINNYLTEINYKLALQVFRLERDIHDILVGYFKLMYDANVLDNVNDGVSRAYSTGNEMHYKLDENTDINQENYNKLIKLIKFIGLDIEEELVQKRGQENVRNYIAHFYLVRNPFEKSLINIIKEMDKLLSYRKRYQNSVMTSVLEVFKGDVELDYNEIKKFNIQKSNCLQENINKLYKNKTITTLNLDMYNTEYNRTLINKLLFSEI